MSSPAPARARVLPGRVPGVPRVAVAVAVAVLLAACIMPYPGPQAPGPDVGHLEPGTTARPGGEAPAISWQRVLSPADVPATPPVPGTWRVHLIDVGTGLAILVQGHDFALLYDAGTNDREEKPRRVIAYLEAALGPSGDDLCVDADTPNPTARQVIDHVVLSHPHFDHASALDLVLHCYTARQIWDSGRVNDAVFYRDFLDAVARSHGATYHTATDVPDSRTVHVKGQDVVMPKDVAWESFHEGDVVQLGASAHFTILHAEGKHHPDPNQNSTVLLVQLGTTRLLLMGDAESGERADPSEAPGDVEAYLLDHDRAELHADILQVGHHGSKTSSRSAFLEAVQPRLALVSTGPKKYGRVVLPDPEVIDALHAVKAVVLRTDEHDGACEVSDRLGADEGPGGCDSYVITIAR